MAKEIYRGELESLIEHGALLVDVRETPEHGTDDALPGHTHLPLSRIAELRSRLTTPRTKRHGLSQHLDEEASFNT
jgi:rhodanese-related sulfurtransferase